MSVIFGIFNRNNKKINIDYAQIMYDTLAYWDYDDKGSWSEDSIFLGHLMLWNSPESRFESLPHNISSKNQTFVISIDSRLDNRKTLAEKLGISDIFLDETTDSDLVLSAYIKWGEDCPKYLLGDFVFVIWDAKKEQLFCVRDHIGIRPFYYFLNDDLFVFSNDICGVSAHPQVSEKYNQKSIAMFLVGVPGFFHKKDTFFEEIQKLPAATSLTITKNHVRESVYWSLDEVSKIYYDTYEEYVENLRDLLSDAVKVRLRTNYPVAAHLSGGLDSSTVAVLASRELKKRDKPLYAFNWIATPDGEYDPTYCEWGFATQLANLENIQQKSINLTAEFIAQKYDEVDITKEDISYFWSEYLVRDEVEKLKARTILSGWGGDELISYNGYSYIRDLFQKGDFLKGIKNVYAQYKDSNARYIYLRTIKRSIKEFLYAVFNRKSLSIYTMEKNAFDPFEFIKDPLSDSLKAYSFPCVYIDPGSHSQQKSRLNGGHLQHRIENWAASAIAKKVEYSYPLLDKHIVEFALGVPEDLFAPKNGHQRYFFRRAISNFLPKNIVWMKKINEPEHGKRHIQLWHESLQLWLQKHETGGDNGNHLVDTKKIVKRLKLFFLDRKKGKEHSLVGSTVVISILLSHLKNKGFELKK